MVIECNLCHKKLKYGFNYFFLIAISNIALNDFKYKLRSYNSLKSFFINGTN